jgi:endonuclease/exonuclease/phosphatase family metal-dependent hydrolase
MNSIKTIAPPAAVFAIALFASGLAFAGSKADIHVMTQNQYLGADLGPIIAADTPAAVNAAMIQALIEVSNNNYPERVQALTESILDKKPHLVALQEMFAFTCVDLYATGLCSTFANAFNDHLALTMDALGGQYRVAAEVRNLTLAPPVLPLPGIPVYLNPLAPPVFVQVIDRDVILARADVETTPVEFNCARPSLDGCNYTHVAPVSVAGIPINIERGFAGVDASVNDQDYRFINTHLEVKLLGGNLASAALQPAQASEFWLAILSVADPTRRLLVAGDFNSSPADVSPIGVVTAYQQLASGQLIDTTPLPFGLTDVWNLRPGNPAGFTCCELADLSNSPSLNYERVDIVFAYPAPAGNVKANVLDTEVDDKTPSGLWPSDHASVSVELNY